MQTLSLMYLFWCKQQQHVVRDKFRALSLQFRSGIPGVLLLVKLNSVFSLSVSSELCFSTMLLVL